MHADMLGSNILDGTSLSPGSLLVSARYGQGILKCNKARFWLNLYW